MLVVFRGCPVAWLGCVMGWDDRDEKCVEEVWTVAWYSGSGEGISNAVGIGWEELSRHWGIFSETWEAFSEECEAFSMIWGAFSKAWATFSGWETIWAEGGRKKICGGCEVAGG